MYLLVWVSYRTSQDMGTLQYNSIHSCSSMRKYSVMDYFSINVGCEENYENNWILIHKASEFIFTFYRLWKQINIR